MSFLNYFSLSELATMYGLNAKQLEELRRTVGILQGVGIAIGFAIGFVGGFLVYA